MGPSKYTGVKLKKGNTKHNGRPQWRSRRWPHFPSRNKRPPKQLSHLFKHIFCHYLHQHLQSLERNEVINHTSNLNKVEETIAPDCSPNSIPGKDHPITTIYHFVTDITFLVTFVWAQLQEMIWLTSSINWVWKQPVKVQHSNTPLLPSPYNSIPNGAS